MTGYDKGGGFREVVLSVRDLAQFVELFECVGRWRVISEHASDPRQLQAWKLPAAARAREVLMGPPGATAGLVRLIRFEGVPQSVIRPAGRTWDTGGILDVNTTVRDTRAIFEEMQRRGWIGYGEPADYTLLEFKVWEAMMQGPDGVVLMFVEWVEPPERRFSADGFASFHNSAIVVRDVQESIDFFVEKLGFKVPFDATWTGLEPGLRVLGLPREIADGGLRRLVLVHPQGGFDSSLQLLYTAGATGVDFAARAVPPNLGILMFRIPIQDVKEYSRHVAGAGVPLAADLARVTAQPYGEQWTFAVRSPTGAWIEFFEPAG